MVQTAQSQDRGARYLIYSRLKFLGITQRQLAKRLNRTPSAISRAIQGDNWTLLTRITHCLNTLESKRGKIINEITDNNGTD